MPEFVVIRRNGDMDPVTAYSFFISDDRTLRFYGSRDELVAVFAPDTWETAFEKGAIKADE